MLREAVGAQDQVSAAYGGLNRINFHQNGSVQVKPIVAPPSRLGVFSQQHLALHFTGFSRIASEIAKEQIRMTPQRQMSLKRCCS